MKKNIKKLLITLFTFLVASIFFYPEKTVLAADYSAYVMGYLTESPNSLANNYALHLAYSTDGLNWTPLNQNNPVITATLGTKGLRDPFIFRKQDGTFVILATDMTGTDMSTVSEYIHCWDSKDLVTFTNERLLKVSPLKCDFIKFKRIDFTVFCEVSILCF